MIYVFNREEILTCILDNSKEDSCPYWNANVKEVLNAEYTFSFTIPLDHRDSMEVQELGYVAFLDYERKYQLFLITEVNEVHSGELVKEVFCEHASIELNDYFIESRFIPERSVGNSLPVILEGTRWSVGVTQNTSPHQYTMERISVREALRVFSERWGVELQFRVVVEGNKITRRYVDALIQRGYDTGKRFEYRKDIQEIRREVVAGEVKTALFGYGKSVGDSSGEESSDTPMDFSSVVWSKSSGNPIDKPLGQRWIGLDGARVSYGINVDGVKHHRFGIYENNDVETPEELLQATYNQLLQSSKPIISYTVKVIDLGKILGIESEHIHLGDMISVIDTDLNLRLKARVIEYDFDLTLPEASEVTLGNFLPVFTSQMDRINSMIQESVRNTNQNVTLPNDLVRTGDIVDVVRETDITDVVRQPQIYDVVRDSEIADVVRQPEIEDVVRQPEIEDVVRQPEIVDVVRQPEIVDVIREPDIVDVVREPDIVDVVRDNDIVDVVRDSDITDVIREGDNIPTDWLQGRIDTLQNEVIAGKGTVTLTQDNGILIVDHPTNPQRALKLNAGTLALASSRDPVTGLFNWRTFGTSEGFLADLVETGKITFNNARGGTLILGGLDNQDGIMEVRNSLGEEIATLSGDYGGFGTLRIDELLNTKNIVYRTWDGIFPDNADPSTGHLYFYIDPNDGDDSYSGTEEYPKQTIQPILDSLPKYLERNVYIRFIPALLNDSIIDIQGFIGPGNLYLQKWDLPIQYVRDFAHGSSANTGNHWIEIHGRNSSGGLEGGNTANLPWNAIPSSSKTTNREFVSDYAIVSGNYYSGVGAQLEHMTVNFRRQITDLEYILVSHYFADGRTYWRTKTQVSSDNNRYFTIFDSERQGTYKETSTGKIHYVNRGYLIGAINVSNNMANIQIRDLFIDSRQTDPTPCINNYHSISLEVKNVVTFGHSENMYNLLANGGIIYISDSEVNYSSVGGICSVYGGHIHAENVVGGGHKYGHFSYGGSITGLAGGVVGSTVNSRTEAGGENRGTWTHKTGTFSPITITQKTQSWNSTSSDTWSEPYGAWRTTDNDVLQGKYSSYGLYRGLWFFGSGMRNTVVNKTIKKIRVYVTRANSSGNTKNSTLTLRWHGYASKGSGIPTMSTQYKQIQIDRGQSMWVDVTNEFKAYFQNGSAFGIGIYTTSTNSAYYIRMSQSLKIEITYEIVS